MSGVSSFINPPVGLVNGRRAGTKEDSRPNAYAYIRRPVFDHVTIHLSADAHDTLTRSKKRGGLSIYPRSEATLILRYAGLSPLHSDTFDSLVTIGLLLRKLGLALGLFFVRFKLMN